MGKYLWQADDAEPEIDPLTRAEASHLVAVARERFPEWHPFVLCGLRTGCGWEELLDDKGGDIDWRSSTIRLSRNIVRGALTTPKSHQKGRVDVSPQLRAVLRLARRRQAAGWLTRGKPRSDAVSASDAGTPLDESNARKAFNGILDVAELHQHGPHQMRRTFASLLLAAGEPITYVSQQLGHRDRRSRSGCTRTGCPTQPRGRASINSMTRGRTWPRRGQTRSRSTNEAPLSRLFRVVSRVGIEPTTRRLRGRVVPIRRFPQRVSPSQSLALRC